MFSPREKRIVWLVAAVQFVNILDFVMVMPLGPDFAGPLGIATAHLGWVGGSYTAAAAISGLIAARFLDRLDRRVALGLAMAGLALGTVSGGFAVDLRTLLLARIVAGACGGPATSVALSIIADTISPERRGRALGTVMTAFSVAATLGVPAGLWLSQTFSWRAPFFAVAGVGALLVPLAMRFLPPLRVHLERRRTEPLTAVLPLLRGDVLLSYAMTATVMAAGFAVIPNISAFVQRNLGFPRTRLDEAYFVMGLVSMATVPLVGRWVDRYGSLRMGTVGSVLLIAVLWFCFLDPVPGISVIGCFVAFTLAQGFRNVSYNTLTTKVPRADERGRFMSIQSSVQHAASALGAGLSSVLLSEGRDGRLVGMPRVAGFSIALTALLPLLLWRVERSVKQRARAEGSPPPELPRVDAVG